MRSYRKSSALNYKVKVNPSKKTVLVVEDDLCCLMSLQLMLQSCGCKVFFANACVKALALLRKRQSEIDLILLDIMMPDKTGIDFLIEARTENILRDIPVVIQSAEDKDDIKKALDKGACGYIQKPYSKAEIFNLVSDLVMKKMSKDNHNNLRVCG